MKGITVFEAFTDIRDDYIRDAELDACLWKPPARKKGMSAFSRFMNSGWGVAVVCVLVAVSVMGGIIWAGFQAGVTPPGSSDLITGDVYITAGGQTVTPTAFFASSEVVNGNQSSIACGSGFYGQTDGTPLPALTRAGDLYLHMPDNYTLDAVYVYDPDTPSEVLYTFEYMDDLQTLTAGNYYVALRITNTEGKSKYCYDYAFGLTVAPEVALPLMKQPYEWPTFDPPASAFLGENTGTYPDGGSVANISLTAAYTRVQTPEGMAWYPMTVRYAQAANGGGLLLLLYDPQSDPSAPYIALDRQLQFLYPPVRTLLQLEDGRLITLHGEEDLSSHSESFEVTANVWIWSKVDPDAGKESEGIQLVPIGEAWSYTFDLTDSLSASRNWQYAFASYIYGLTDGEIPTLRVLLDNLFCETDEVKYDLAQYESFSEEENLTAGWARLQRIMNGQLRPDLWVWPETLDLTFCEFGLGNRLHVNFNPDGSLWILFGHFDDIQSIYRGTYVIRDGSIAIDCPIDANYFGFSLHGTHAFERSETNVKIGDLDIKIEGHDATCPTFFIPLVVDFFNDLNASVAEYRQVRPESYAVIDMDGDETDEIVVKLAWDGKASDNESYVFFIDPATEKIADYTKISYSYLYEDGSFSYTFDRTGPSYGVDKLVVTGKEYKLRTLWRIYNDGSENAEYYMGDRKVTWEELEAYITEIECEKVTWTACSWEITESKTDAYADVTEDGKGAPIEPPSGGKG